MQGVVLYSEAPSLFSCLTGRILPPSGCFLLSGAFYGGGGRGLRVGDAESFSIRILMKNIRNMMTQGTALVLSAALLSSCYFNSAGHIFDKASYNAVTNTADIRPGHTLYVDEGCYYVELPRYRYDVPIRTQYSVFKDAPERKKVLRKKNDSELMQIPEDYAMYLIGKRSQPTTPSFMKRVTSGAEVIKKRAKTYQIARSPQETLSHFRYDSPSSFGWYCLGVLDWLCVDLPVTCTENALVAGLFAGMVLSAAENPSSLSSRSKSSSSEMSDLDYLVKCAKQGDADAQFALASCYKKGEHGLPQDEAAAFSWFLAAAQQGHVDAMFWVGIAYFDGKGVRQNGTEGLRWMTLAAQRGDQMAQCSVGMEYYYGHICKKDWAKARYWFKLSAAQGNDMAMEYLQKMGS